ncbi:MAG: efflux RND transporter periplasmic adaptor subunit [bacterium]|nr:efflux RND transporter periplasmic adaptor subunit [bacterium]
MSEKKLKVVLPIAILFLGIAGTVAIIKSRSPVPTKPPEEYAPLVRVMTVELTTHHMVVTAYGTVKPRTESVLVSEVSGRVTYVSATFAEGGFFEAGDALVRVDPRDHELAVVIAKSQVAQARVRAELEEAQAEVAREEWKTLGAGKTSPLATRELQLQEAIAALASAEAGLERAQRTLDRTQIRAPFAGRVRQTMVDRGQFVSPGTPVATIYAVDYVEVRLPIPDHELAYLDLPINYRGDQDRKTGPEVTLRAEFAGSRHSWSGRIVRVEGEIDPVSRMVHVIAQVDDPYARTGPDEDPMPLAIGLFVEAEISGHELSDVVVLPRTAVRRDQTVLVVDGEDRVRFRPVEVIRLSGSEAVIGGGLESGERVCVSVIEAATDGMKVRTLDVTGEKAESEAIKLGENK